MENVLANEILNIIDETICGEYVGKLEVIVDGDWYVLNLFMNMYQAPLVMAYQGTEEKFKEFIREEIKKRKLEKVMRYEVRRELPALECDWYEKSKGNW